MYCMQIKQYDLVIQLSEEGAALSTREIRSSSRDTLLDFERDMALATALAQVRTPRHLWGVVGWGAPGWGGGAGAGAHNPGLLVRVGVCVCVAAGVPASC